MKHISRRASSTAMLPLLLLFATAHADEGIWKAYVPPAGSMKGQFQNNDPVGLAAGAEIAADCSLNWVDPDDRKIYCFSSGTSLEIFLDAPQAHLARARTTWAKLHPSS